MIKPLAKHLLSRLGYKITRAPASPAGQLSLADLPDLPASDRATIQRVQPFTLTSPQRLAAVIDATRHIVRHHIPGDLAECGVWRGGSIMAAALTLLQLGDTSRTLYLYDTFEGMPPPTDADRDLTGASAAALLQRDTVRTGVWAYADLADVKRNLLSTGYPSDKLRFIAGKVEDTIPATIPPSLALLRLDTDWYSSTRHELAHLYPRVNSGGFLIIDDYGHWQGARQATDEFLQQLDHPLFLHRVDYTARLAVKP